jgi:myo-inositol-1(or 4)-monophosphatase
MCLEQQALSQILETAVVAARLAGQRAMEEINYVKATLKNGTELVTDTDRRCQQLIVDRIKETFPDHGFIGEEGIPIFTVSISVLHQGRPIVGVVFDPGTESMYTAVHGGDTHLNGRRIEAGEDDIAPTTSVGLDSHFGEPLPAWVARIVRESRFRNFGTTALQLAYVASGGLVGTVVCTPKLWDVAAGVLIAEAAGAVATNWKGEPLFPVDLDAYQGQAMNVLAANRKAHSKLVDWIGA